MKINFEKKEKLILATKTIFFFPYYMCNVNMISSLYVKFLHIKLYNIILQASSKMINKPLKLNYSELP